MQNRNSRLGISRWILIVVVLVIPNIASAALNFSFDAANESSRPGESFQLEWIVVNDGSNQENNITVEFPMPGSGIAGISDSETDGGACPGTTCDAGETIVWSVGNIPAGESRMATFALDVPSNTPNGGIALTGRLFRSNSLVSTSAWSQEVSVALVAELAIDSSDAHVSSDTPFSFGILAGNRGTAPLNGAVLSVPVPTGLTILSAPGASVSGNTATWNLGNLSAGRVTRRVVNVTLSSSLGTGDLLVMDNATLTGSVFGVSQSTTANHVVTVGNPPLKFQIRAQETQFRPGEAQNIEILASNTTNQVLQNTTVHLMYPLRLSSISDSDTGGGGCPGTTCDVGEKMIWSLGNLLPGETRQIRFDTGASSSSSPGLPVRWQASVRTGSNVVRRDYLATGNSSVDVNLQVDSNETRVSAGDEFVYTFHVGNTGVGPMNSVVLSVPVPNGITVLQTYGGTLASGVVTWQLSNVSAGSLKHRYLKVRADSNLPRGTLINLIDAEASTTVFGIPESSMAQHIVSVGDAPIDLELRIQQAAVRRGESMVMEIVASNTGFQVEQNVVVTLLYPDDMSSKSDSRLEIADCSGTTCDPGEQMVASFGNLVPGETKSILVTMTANSSALLGEHTTWMGSVSAGGGLSRQFEATVGITEVAPELQITTDDLLVAQGANVKYQIASGNSGGGILSQATLLVPIPAGTTVVSSPGGSVQSGRVVYNIGDIDDVEIVLRELTLAMSSGTPAGTQFTLENVELSGFIFGVEQMTYANHVVTVGSSPLTGQISVSPSDARAGDTVDVTIDIVNSGSQVEQNVMAVLLYPTGVVSRSEADMDGGSCVGTTCDPEEHVFWSLGNLIPGDSRQINFSTTILTSQREGDMIEWGGRLQTSGIKQRRIEFGSLVGNVTGPITETELFCNGRLVNVELSKGETATSGDDVILGTTGNDVIRAFGGNDTICGLEGNDTIFAGNGDDWVDAGAGDDEVQGSNGIDMIFGDSGDDLLAGGPGTDSINGEAGDDTLFGNSGADVIEGGDGVDEIRGGSGNDDIATGAGATVGSGVIVDGGAGDDIITGGVDADEIRGSSDDDTIFGGGGDDRLFGGGGEDTILGESGNDLIRGNAGNDDLSGGNGNDNINGFGSRDTIRGGAGDDVLDGSTGNDFIQGESGNDIVRGGGGNDQLFGNSGEDLLEGGGGNDELDGGGSSPDTCDGQSGTDTATASCEVVLNIP